MFTVTSQSFRGATLAFFLALVLVHSAFAGQANYARLAGTISDPSGGVLPGAALVLRNVRTNVTQEAVTDGQGRFNFSEVPIGEYELTVTLQGFRRLVRSDITLLTGQVADMPLQLQVGAPEAVVEVTGSIPLVQSSTSTVQTAM